MTQWRVLSNSSAGLDTERLLTNLDMAINMYIDRVDGAPCGKGPITLFKGAKNEHANKLQDRCHELLTFLKGTPKNCKQSYKQRNQMIIITSKRSGT